MFGIHWKENRIVILLRRYHDIGEKYVQRLTGKEVWMLPKRLPTEVMCHGDFAPYNITFVDTYELKNCEREQLPNMIIDRISSLVAYMRNEADSGNEDVQKNIKAGHLKLYLDDMQYIKEYEKKILEGIL